MSKKVNAIANGFEILKCLSKHSDMIGVTEVSRQTGISPSSCFNMLRTLVDLGYATFDSKTKRYGFGLGIFVLANGSAEKHNPVLRSFQPLLIELAKKHKTHCSLWEIVNHDSPTLVAIGESTMPLRISLQIGTTQSIGSGSVGRACLSMRNDNKQFIREAFSEVSWQGEITFDEYLDQIKTTANVGYSIDQDQYFLGMTTLSTPFIEESTDRWFTLTMICLSGAEDDDSLNAKGTELKQKVLELGYSSNLN